MQISVRPSSPSVSPSCSCRSGRRDSSAPIESAKMKNTANIAVMRLHLLRPRARAASCRAHSARTRLTTISGSADAERPADAEMLGDKAEKRRPEQERDERDLRQRGDIGRRRPVGALRRRRHREREDHAGADAQQRKAERAPSSRSARRRRAASRPRARRAARATRSSASSARRTDRRRTASPPACRRRAPPRSPQGTATTAKMSRM